MLWKELEVNTTSQYAEAIATLLTEQGALAVSLKDAADQPLFQLQPDETPLWQSTKVIGLFGEETDINMIVELLKNEGPEWYDSIKTQIIQNQDWVRESQRHFPLRCFSDRLWLIPSWCNPNNYRGAKFLIDPGLAFGTGTHPTTAMCLQWLAENPPENQLVVDYGCGSGILSLASFALGAKHIYAVDNDRQALEATKNNAALNQFSADQLSVLLPPQMPNISADVVIGNILSETLIQLASTLGGLVAPKGTLLLGGILASETENVVTAYAKDFSVVTARHMEEWTLLILKRR